MKMDILASENVTCQECYHLRRKLDESHKQHCTDYLLLKKRIISTSSLIKKYKILNAETEVLTKKHNETLELVRQLQNECKKYEQDLSECFLKLTPLEKDNRDLTKLNKEHVGEIDQLKCHVQSFEMLVSQLQSSIAEKEKKEQQLKNELKCGQKPILDKNTELKRKVKRYENVMSKLFQYIDGLFEFESRKASPSQLDNKEKMLAAITKLMPHLTRGENQDENEACAEIKLENLLLNVDDPKTLMEYSGDDDPSSSFQHTDHLYCKSGKDDDNDVAVDPSASDDRAIPPEDVEFMESSEDDREPTLNATSEDRSNKRKKVKFSKIDLTKKPKHAPNNEDRDRSVVECSSTMDAFARDVADDDQEPIPNEISEDQSNKRKKVKFSKIDLTKKPKHAPNNEDPDRSVVECSSTMDAFARDVADDDQEPIPNEISEDQSNKRKKAESSKIDLTKKPERVPNNGDRNRSGVECASTMDAFARDVADDDREPTPNAISEDGSNKRKKVVKSSKMDLTKKPELVPNNEDRDRSGVECASTMDAFAVDVVADDREPTPSTISEDRSDGRNKRKKVVKSSKMELTKKPELVPNNEDHDRSGIECASTINAFAHDVAGDDREPTPSIISEDRSDGRNKRKKVVKSSKMELTKKPERAPNNEDHKWSGVECSSTIDAFAQDVAKVNGQQIELSAVTLKEQCKDDNDDGGTGCVEISQSVADSNFAVDRVNRIIADDVAFEKDDEHQEDGKNDVEAHVEQRNFQRLAQKVANSAAKECNSRRPRHERKSDDITIELSVGGEESKNPSEDIVGDDSQGKPEDKLAAKPKDEDKKTSTAGVRLPECSSLWQGGRMQRKGKNRKLIAAPTWCQNLPVVKKAGKTSTRVKLLKKQVNADDILRIMQLSDQLMRPISPIPDADAVVPPVDDMETNTAGPSMADFDKELFGNSDSDDSSEALPECSKNLVRQSSGGFDTSSLPRDDK